MNGNLAPILPGDSPDPEQYVEREMKAAWALGGIAVSAGIVSYALNRIGFTFLPPNPEPLDYARASAFLLASANILCWMWFPLEDLRVLRTWVRTKKAFFSAHTAEFMGMILATVLLSSLIISSTISALAFGLAGAGVYAWNLLGFAIIRQQVSRVLAESRILYSKDVSPQKAFLQRKALGIIEKHWACSPTSKAWCNRQQIRHFLLTVSFSVVASFGLATQLTGKAEYGLYAYILGSVTIVGAEISIAKWRSERDKELHRILEKLRALNAGTT